MKKNVDIKTSFTAADSIPLKVLLDQDLIQEIEAHSRLLPVHIQFLPTNRCNLNCKFCSCAERDKDLEMDIDLARRIIGECKKAGTKAVTITGGGDPLMYPHFSELIDCFHENDIKIGLVCNGILLEKADVAALKKITWCRISNDDFRTFTPAYRDGISRVVTAAPEVDWAFSHVVSSTPNVEEIAKIVTFANEHRFTHVRLVADLFHPEYINMEVLGEKLRAMGVDDAKVIYQGRKAFERGGDCYIGYIKPLIGPDAKVYACCGVQYALEEPSKDLPEELCLGDARDIADILSRSNVPLDGRVCAKCYYTNYNTLLRAMLASVEHKEFL